VGVPPVAYLRKSVVRQDDPNNSAEAQEAAVRAMAARHGDAEGLVVLSDWDKSGGSGERSAPATICSGSPSKAALPRRSTATR